MISGIATASPSSVMASITRHNLRRHDRSSGRRFTAEGNLSPFVDRFEPVFDAGLADELSDDPIVPLTGSASDGVSDSFTRDQLPLFENSINNSKNIVSVDEAVSFTLTRQLRPLEGLITGLRNSGAEAVRGTQGDDLIGDGEGKDQLIGLSGADDFLFDDAEAFGRKRADVIRDFSAAEGDRLLLDAGVFGDDASLGVADSRRQLKQMANDSDFDLLYFQPKGRLFFNENGDEAGFGDGGLFCTIKNVGAITSDQIALV